jgi:hypothetical protein
MTRIVTVTNGQSIAVNPIETIGIADPYTVQSTGFLNTKQAYIFTILGNRTAFVDTTNLHDVCEFLTNGAGQQRFTPVTTSDALELVSTSANDTLLGTGTRKVRITYLNSLGELVESPDINMNGTTAVATGITATAIQWMETADGGSLEVSAGTINLRKTGTPTTIYEQIVANGNKSQSARFTVPVGYTGYLLDWNVAALVATMDVRLRATTKTLTRDNNPRYLFQERIFLSIGQNYSGNLNYLKYKAGATIKVSAIPGATNGTPRCDASFTILIVAD